MAQVILFGGVLSLHFDVLVLCSSAFINPVVLVMSNSEPNCLLATDC
jgi:hypothetical protein